MNAGRMRDRVTLRRPTSTENDFGKPDHTYATLGKARRSASVKARGGLEKRIADQMAVSAEYMVEMRADSTTKTLRETDSILWHGPNGDVELGIVFIDDSQTQAGALNVQCEKKRT